MTRPFTSEPVWVAVRSVLICDGRSEICHAVAGLAKSIPTAVDVAVVTDGSALSAAFAVKHVDLVLIGLSPGSPGGVAAVEQLLARYPAANVIVYGSARDTAALTAAVARGARGFLLWTPDERRLLFASTGLPGPREPAHAQRAVGAGPSVKEGWPDPLTERELQVLRGMVRGQTNREISRELFLSADTVKTHASRLFRRLGAHDRSHAVALAMRRGLIA